MMRAAGLLATAVSAATLVSLAVPVSHHAIWNATASVPTGLYLLRGKASLHVGERVAIAPPPYLRRLLAERGYLPAGVPLLKRVAAISGQRVCRIGFRITIDGLDVGRALTRDRAGRALPAWSGCRVLRQGELFLMSPSAADSFDGRYFGVLRLTDVIGRAAPIWTDESGRGDYVWRADPRTFDTPITRRKGDSPCASEHSSSTTVATAAACTPRRSTSN